VGIYVLEGEYEKGTILFPNSFLERAEIFWKRIGERQVPRVVKVSGKKSVWRTPEGISLGTDLCRLEELNRRPFLLAGFGWDYYGTVTSWSGGRLEKVAPAPCEVRARLVPEERPRDVDWQRWYRQVLGDRRFSSGHPAMQALNPQVYELFLVYR
jgi:hypothetical protein